MPQHPKNRITSEQASAKEECLRHIEMIQIAPLVSRYLEKLIGPEGRYALSWDCKECVSWFGVRMIRAERDHEEIEETTLTFQMDYELTEALSLPEQSVLKLIMPDRTGHYYIYYDDLIEVIGLRLSDRTSIIDRFSLEQLEEKKAYIETILPVLMMKNE